MHFNSERWSIGLGDSSAPLPYLWETTLAGQGRFLRSTTLPVSGGSTQPDGSSSATCPTSSATPWLPSKAAVETLQNGALSEPDTARNFLQRIEDDLGRMITMADELLELSRLGKRPGAPSPVPDSDPSPTARSPGQYEGVCSARGVHAGGGRPRVAASRNGRLGEAQAGRREPCA